MLITFFQDGLLVLLKHVDLPASCCALFGMILYLSGTLHCSKKKYGWCLQRRRRQAGATEEEHEIVRNKKMIFALKRNWTGFSGLLSPAARVGVYCRIVLFYPFDIKCFVYIFFCMDGMVIYRLLFDIFF